MIIPFFKGIDKPNKVPVTWTLLFINVFVFIFCNSFESANDDVDLSSFARDEHFVVTQARVYARYVLENEKEYSPMVLFKAQEALLGDRSALQILGTQLSFQDGKFIESVSKKGIPGDQIAIQNWRSQLLDLNRGRFLHPTFMMGINYFQRDLKHLISYQFSHSGIMHLAFNMFFLLIFGSLLEPLLGSLLFLCLYLLGGIFAGYGFWLYAGLSAVPLVGSSGSISALIGIAFALLLNKKAKFFYFMGFVRLPIWAWALYFWLLLDLAGLFKSVPGFGTQIAHSAHIGGTLAGYIMGVALLLGLPRLKEPIEELGHELLIHSRSRNF